MAMSMAFSLSHFSRHRPSFSLISSTPLLNSHSSRPSRRIQFHQIHCSKKEAPSKTDPKLGVPVYKPKSYEVLVADAANSLSYALDDGKTRLEIDFP